MTTYSITVMHPGGTTYDFKVEAYRWYLDHDSIIFVKEENKVEIFPQAFTIVKEK